MSKIAVDTPINDLQYIIDLLYGISEILAGLVTFDFSKVLNGLSALAGGELDHLAANFRTYAQAIGIDTDALEQKIGNWAKGVGEKFSNLWASIKEIWGKVSSWFDEKVIQPIKNVFEPIVEWFSNLWSGVKGTFSDTFYNVGEIAKGSWTIIQIKWQEAKDFFGGLWTSITTSASTAWETIKEKVQSITAPIKESVGKISSQFSDLWGKLKGGAEGASKGIKDAFSGIKHFFKDILNGVIKSLNSGLTKIFGGINTLLTRLKNLSIAGVSPFSGVRTITVPQIPYLAQGAVLPPNKPFMAVVGDQKHGTNIEAPLTTIQEAVAQVMENQIAAMMTGFEALLDENIQLRRTVEGISIGDDVIGQAVARYNRKMAVVRGV